MGQTQETTTSQKKRVCLRNAKLHVEKASLAPSPSALVVAIECGRSTDDEAIAFGASSTGCEKKLEQTQGKTTLQKKRVCLKNAKLHVDEASNALCPSPLVVAIQCGRSTGDQTIAFGAPSTACELAATTKKRFILKNAKLPVPSIRALVIPSMPTHCSCDVLDRWRFFFKNAKLCGA